jgi:two-component system LytT family sensor kinase
MITKILRELIFSERLVWRFIRHSLTWLLLFIISTTQTLSTLSSELLPEDPAKLLEFLVSGGAPQIIFRCGLVFCMLIPFAYFIVYWLLPQFLYKKRYVVFAFSLLSLTILYFVIQFAIYGMFNGLRAEQWLFGIWMAALGFAAGEPLGYVALFAAAKFLKTWYVSEANRISLTTATVVAELQVLREQVHPHFLFNTLNSIYSLSLDRSPLAAELVVRLKNVIHYMIEHRQKEFVMLEDEIKLISDYIELQRARFGNRLRIEVLDEGDTRSFQLAPLLMIPLIENAFKHGASQMVKDPWIKISMRVEDARFSFEVTNNKPLEVSASTHGGIGLVNVKRRLELLYGTEHQFSYKQDKASFHVFVSVPIRREDVPAEVTVTDEAFAFT